MIEFTSLFYLSIIFRNFETMIHFLKGNIGTGIFSMPSAFKNSGLWVGTGLLPIFAIICTHCKFTCFKSFCRSYRHGSFYLYRHADVGRKCRTKKFVE